MAIFDLQIYVKFVIYSNFHLIYWNLNALTNFIWMSYANFP